MPEHLLGRSTMPSWPMGGFFWGTLQTQAESMLGMSHAWGPFSWSWALQASAEEDGGITPHCPHVFPLH